MNCRHSEHRVTFILGADKHAGKTTYLKYALARSRAEGRRPAYLSVGVDGERQDLAFGGPKPALRVERGDIVATTSRALAVSDADFRLLHVLPDASAFGRPAVAEALRPGRLELIGPGSNRQVGDLLAFLRNDTAADAILIDGAADRMTQVASAGEADCVMVLRITPETLPGAASRMRRMHLLRQVQQAPTEFGSDVREVPGALTRDKLAEFPDRCDVVLQDFTRVFLTHHETARFLRERHVWFRRVFRLRRFVVNLVDVTADELHATLAGDVPPSAVELNPYTEAVAC